MALLPDVSQVWRRDPAWAAIYARGVATEPVAVVAGRLFWGTDVRLLYRATAVIGEQPAGAAILDIPCGGGIALRGLRHGQPVRYVAADISDAMLERTRRDAERRGVRDMVEPPMPTLAPSWTKDAASSSVTTFSRRLLSRRDSSSRS